MGGGGNIRPEWFREHSEDYRIFYDIKREVQIQIQIVLVSAYEILTETMLIEWKRSHAHSGAPTNTRFAAAHTACCIVSTIGTLTQSVFHMNTWNHVLGYNLSRTITTRRDGGIKRPDEFIADLFENVCDVPCQFRPYYIHVVRIIQI